MDDDERMAPGKVIEYVCEMLGVQKARAKHEIARKVVAGKLKALGSLPNGEWRRIPPQAWKDGLDTWVTSGNLPDYVWIEFITKSVLRCFSRGAASSRDGEGAAASPKHGGGRPLEYDWHILAGEALRLHHLRGISTANKMVNALTKLLESRGEKAPSRTQFMEYVPKWLRALKNKPYDDKG